MIDLPFTVRKRPRTAPIRHRGGRTAGVSSVDLLTAGAARRDGVAYVAAPIEPGGTRRVRDRLPMRDGTPR